MLKPLVLIGLMMVLALFGGQELMASTLPADDPPNVLIAISDDQSYPHASAYGSQAVKTPNFDRVAREGVLFDNAFVASPGCSPSRAAMLTGRYPWQLEHAGTHASLFPQKYVTFPGLLEEAGYFIGYTGKGWGPGDWKASGRPYNPAGPAYNDQRLEAPHEGISSKDYAANFKEFLDQRPNDQPFYFWYGAHEPHRRFEKGAGREEGKRLYEVQVPSFLPDAPEVREDLLDYALEIEWFDRHLGQMLNMLEEAGELENTIVIVTSDNGMAFPRAKANAFEYGIHVPLAVMWPQKVAGGGRVEKAVSLVDLAPTVLEAADVDHPGQHPMTGKSLLALLTSEEPGNHRLERGPVFAGRERHSSSRYHSLSYPQRAVRTDRYLYIRNFKPERWPAGAPQKYRKDGSLGPMHGGYHDIDAAPSLDYLVENRTDPVVSRYFHLAVDKRPAEELYDIQKDPGGLENLMGAPGHVKAAKELRQTLNNYLKKTKDPRVMGNGDIWETYHRVSHLRQFPEPEWAKEREKVFRPKWIDRKEQ